MGVADCAGQEEDGTSFLLPGRSDNSKSPGGNKTSFMLRKPQTLSIKLEDEVHHVQSLLPLQSLLCSLQSLLLPVSRLPPLTFYQGGSPSSSVINSKGPDDCLWTGGMVAGADELFPTSGALSGSSPCLPLTSP
eukprot:281199-Hanusia_phi.AAC.2